MKRVNLLPTQPSHTPRAAIPYRQAAGIGLLLIMLMPVVWCGAHYKSGRIQRQAADERGRLQIAQAEYAELSRSESHLQQVRKSIVWRDSLEEPISTAAVLSLVSRLTPESVYLSKFQLEMPTPIRTKRTPSPKLRSDNLDTPIRVQIEAIARNEVEAARCVTCLSGHQLFANVKLAKSRQILDGGPKRVAFQLTLDIPVDRKFIRAGEEGKGNGF